MIIGDYLQVTANHVNVHGRGEEEGFARVERIEHLPEGMAKAAFSHQSAGFGPVPTVWCHGVPGPLILRGGDVYVLDYTSPERVQHDLANRYWPDQQGSLLRGAYLAGDKPFRWRRDPGPQTHHINWPQPHERPRVSRRATSFSKPASALRVGDYFGIHTNRWPEGDRDVDEGFARVEHLHVLDRAGAEQLFADDNWHTVVVAVSAYGLAGILLLRAADDIEVMAFVNPEREAYDRRQMWNGRPLLELTGSRPPIRAEQQRADEMDAARRPHVNEAAWYPSRFSDSVSRRMAMESTYGFRTMPLSALPWPHRQSDCRMGTIARPANFAVPDNHAAHAAAFLSPQGQEVMTSCPYHQPNWPRLVRILEETLDTVDDNAPDVERHPEYGQLSDDEKQWLRTLVVEPIEYNDHDNMLDNGQHRLCALRAAGIAECPVRGHFLPDTDYGLPVSATEHARATIKASWQHHAAEHRLPSWVGTAATHAPRGIRAWLLRRTVD